MYIIDKHKWFYTLKETIKKTLYIFFCLVCRYILNYCQFYEHTQQYEVPNIKQKQSHIYFVHYVLTHNSMFQFDLVRYCILTPYPISASPVHNRSAPVQNVASVAKYRHAWPISRRSPIRFICCWMIQMFNNLIWFK